MKCMFSHLKEEEKYVCIVARTTQTCLKKLA